MEERVIDRLREAGEGGASTSQVYRRLAPGGLRADELHRILNELVSLRLVESAKQESGGRPVTLWRLARAQA